MRSYPLRGEYPTAPEPMDAERRQRLSAEAEREAYCRRQREYAEQFDYTGAEALIEMIRGATDWISMTNLTLRTGLTPKSIGNILRWHVTAGRVERRYRGRNGACRNPVAEYRWVA